MATDRLAFQIYISEDINRMGRILRGAVAKALTFYGILLFIPSVF
jgi:hypothetical protein